MVAIGIDFDWFLPVGECRMKDVAQKQYTQNEAMQGAGKGVETYKPAHPKPSGDDMEDL